MSWKEKKKIFQKAGGKKTKRTVHHDVNTVGVENVLIHGTQALPLLVVSLHAQGRVTSLGRVPGGSISSGVTSLDRMPGGSISR